MCKVERQPKYQVLARLPRQLELLQVFALYLCFFARPKIVFYS